MDKHLVVVSREWHEPFVRVSLTDLDLKIVMSLEDFSLAVAQEAGFSEAAMLAAVEAVVRKMKRETTKII